MLLAYDCRSEDLPLSVARVVEISSTSPKSFEDAIVQGIERANQTLRNVKSAWVKEQEADVENGKVVAYKVHSRPGGAGSRQPGYPGCFPSRDPERLP
jgi:hypothetical protein